MTKSPLWLLFILTSIVLSYLQLSISIDVEESEKDIQLTPYYKLVFRSLIVGIVMAIIYIIFSPERPLFEAILTGSILFICFLVSYSVSYFHKKSVVYKTTMNKEEGLPFLFYFAIVLYQLNRNECLGTYLLCHD